MTRDRLAFAAWLAVIAAAMYFGRQAQPFIEGPARAMLGWVVGLVWAWFLALGLRLWLGLAPERRRRGWPWLLAALAGLMLLAWAQPLMIERLHVVLYGVLGLLAYRLFRGRAPGRPRWQPALLWAVAVSLADELAQALHPERVGDPRDVATNAVAAGLLVMACALLDPDQPAPEPARPPC